MKVACFAFATSLIFMAACQSGGSTHDAGGTPGTGGRGGSDAAGGQSVQAGAGGTAGAAGIAGVAGTAGTAGTPGAAGTTGAAGHGGAPGSAGAGGRGGTGGLSPCGTGQTWCVDCDGAGHCSPGAGCPGASCPPPDAGTTIACSALTTLAACDARGDCHSVFTDPQKCGCPTLGCCATFARCVAGGRATCTGSPTCEAPTPYCEGPYVVSYTAFCYDGCVRATACSP
ncbi:MAG TPA: hypothetical protein VHU40_09195 [Polyangia bacterium]|jgi:hypothetical protein|nr:hypothetical protein [Polyangia bacterium]